MKLTPEQVIVRLMEELEGYGDRLSYSEFIGEEYDTEIEDTVRQFIKDTKEAHQ